MGNKESFNPEMGNLLTPDEIKELKEEFGLQEDNKSLYMEGVGGKTHHIAKVVSADDVREWAEETKERIKKDKEEQED